jgi:hypothetical protein
MHTTIAVEGQVCAMRETTCAASFKPRPWPPTDVAETSPSRPALPSAWIVSRGKRASLSVRKANGCSVSVSIPASTSR